jgi:hypothetical protein
MSVLKAIQRWSHRRRFREGRTLSRFIARDVRREILIVSAARLEEGIITGRVRTTNVLYVSNPDFALRMRTPEPTWGYDLFCA